MSGRDYAILFGVGCGMVTIGFTLGVLLMYWGFERFMRTRGYLLIRLADLGVEGYEQEQE